MILPNNRVQLTANPLRSLAYSFTLSLLFTGLFMNDKCYMCDNPATTKEHVPPKCLFPEKKDTSLNMDLRKNLITVPSCEKHNLKKSKDDEYILFCLVINILSNKVGLNQFLTKVLRAIKRNPKLINQFLNGHELLYVENKYGLQLPTVGVKVDPVRIESAFEKIGRALYYHHNNKQWKYNIFVRPEFLLFIDQIEYKKLNKELETLSSEIDRFFSDKEYYGENPAVFKYQYYSENELTAMMRLYFYGDSKVTLFFTDKTIS